MIETDTSIIIHTPRCGGTTLYEQGLGTLVHRAHDGVSVLSEVQRKKQILVLTRNRKDWYQSLFQYCVQVGDPWMHMFGLENDPSFDNFKEYLHRATYNPPPVVNISMPRLMSAPFDGFSTMRKKNYGFWSAWHEFLASDDLDQPAIATDVLFVPCGDKSLHNKERHNTSDNKGYEWTEEMISWLEQDADVARIVTEQSAGIISESNPV